MHDQGPQLKQASGYAYIKKGSNLLKYQLSRAGVQCASALFCARQRAARLLLRCHCPFCSRTGCRTALRELRTDTCLKIPRSSCLLQRSAQQVCVSVVFPHKGVTAASGTASSVVIWSTFIEGLARMFGWKGPRAGLVGASCQPHASGPHSGLCKYEVTLFTHDLLKDMQGVDNIY